MTVDASMEEAHCGERQRSIEAELSMEEGRSGETGCLADGSRHMAERREIEMKCVGCGAELEAGALLCPNCGRVVSSEDVAKSKAQSGQLTKKEFYKLPGMKACRGNIRGCAIILYVCSGMTPLASVLAQVLVTSSVLDGIELSASIIDGVLLLALGLWLQFGKSRICAILTLCYGIFNMVVIAMAKGQVQGWLIPLAGGWAIAYTFKFHNLWGKYKKTGKLPDEAVK